MPNHPKEQSSANLDAALIPNRRLPANVFHERWSTFFFDSDLLFDFQFVKIIKALLDCEKSTILCMRNLEISETENGSEPASLFFDMEVTGEAYIAYLRGSGWLYRMDRYGLISEIGCWCIYCERNNEIAVIALSSHKVPEYRGILQHISAAHISQALQESSGIGLSKHGLSTAWKETLLREYSL